MESVKDIIENGVPVDFRVSFDNKEIVKMVGVIFALTIGVVIVTLVIKRSFFK